MGKESVGSNKGESLRWFGEVEKEEVEERSLGEMEEERRGRETLEGFVRRRGP